MSRRIVLIAALIYCAVFWFVLARVAGYVATHRDAQTLLAALLIAGGLAMVIAGGVAREAGLRWIENPRGFGLAKGGRYIVAVGSVVLAAGAGATLSLAVAAL
jgi:hypothetical protein